MTIVLLVILAVLLFSLTMWDYKASKKPKSPAYDYSKTRKPAKKPAKKKKSAAMKRREKDSW